MMKPNNMFWKCNDKYINDGKILTSHFLDEFEPANSMVRSESVNMEKHDKRARALTCLTTSKYTSSFAKRRFLDASSFVP